MEREKSQSEFKYDKNSLHLPMLGVGPIYVLTIWIAYDLPGNAGWILYFVGLILTFAGKPKFMELQIILPMMAVAIVPALFMLVGIVELISKRIHKLDRILSHVRLLRGFGALTLGGVTGTAITAVMLICATWTETGELLYLWLMLAGGILCGVFAGLLFRRYIENEVSP